MTYLKKPLTLLCGLVLFCSLQAQSIIVENNQQPFSGYGNRGIGQSFIAPIDGEMTAISVRSFTNSNVTLYVFDSADTSGTPIYSQSGINLILSSSTAPQQQINLDTPVPISAGQTYSFILIGSGGMMLYSNNANDYADGMMLYYDGTNYGSSVGRDIEFAIYAQQSSTAAPAAPRAIPSTSSWALTVILLLMIGTTLSLRRKS